MWSSEPAIPPTWSVNGIWASIEVNTLHCTGDSTLFMVWSTEVLVCSYKEFNLVRLLFYVFLDYILKYNNIKISITCNAKNQ